MAFSLFEEGQNTWTKRFLATHYAYRDFHQVATVPLAEAAAFMLAAATPPSPTVYYLFGTNARAAMGGNRFNWPNIRDLLYTVGQYQYLNMVQCYARDILLYSTQEAWIRFICVNPVYEMLAAQQYTAGQITGFGISAVIIENERHLPRLALRRYFPTKAVAIIFRAPFGGVAGVLDIDIEGNMEGTE